MNAIRKILDQNCIDKLEDCKEFCSGFTISGSSDVRLFNTTEINQCASFKQLFAILHWSWEEYSLLKGIITECGSPKKAMEELYKFEKFMASYRGMKYICDKKSLTLSPEDYPYYWRLYAIIEESYKDLTLDDITELQTFIFKHLDLHESTALPYLRFFYKSLHLEWYIPVQAVSHVIKMVHKNKKAFIQKSFVLIKVGDKTILDTQSESSQSDASKVSTLDM